MINCRILEVCKHPVAGAIPVRFRVYARSYTEEFLIASCDTEEEAESIIEVFRESVKLITRNSK